MLARARSLAVAALLLVLPAACLEFDGQDIVVHQDVTKDRLDVHLVYRGLLIEREDSGDPAKKALADLDHALASGMFAIWDNWPLKIDLTAKITGPKAALAQHVEVENGGVFTDPLGMLCAHQFVRVNDFTGFLAKVNTGLDLLMTKAVTTGIEVNGQKRVFDDDTKELAQDFQRAKQKMLVVTPGRIELRLPISLADHRWLRQRAAAMLAEETSTAMVRRVGTAQRRANEGPPSETAVAPEAVALRGEELAKQLELTPIWRFFADNDVSVARAEGLTTIALGSGEGEIRIVKAASGFYHDALLKKLRERGAAIEDGVPDQELGRRFAAFCERDPVLPPELAKARGK